LVIAGALFEQNVFALIQHYIEKVGSVITSNSSSS